MICHSRVAAGAARRGLMMVWSARSADCAAVLGPGSRGITRCATCGRSAQTHAASQPTKRAARASPGPAFLAAHKSPPPGTAHRSVRVGVLRGTACHRRVCKGVCETPRSAGLVATRAPARARALTRRTCLSEVNAANAASCARGHETEHRRGKPGRASVPADSCSPGAPVRLASRTVDVCANGAGRLRLSGAACPHAPLSAQIKDLGLPLHAPPQSARQRSTRQPYSHSSAS
jgi:hypothetical protein